MYYMEPPVALYESELEKSSLETHRPFCQVLYATDGCLHRDCQNAQHFSCFKLCKVCFQNDFQNKPRLK